MPQLLIWHVWPGQGWPASAAQELEFLEDLRAAVGTRRGAASRPSITCVLNALRNAVSLDTVLRVLPGARPEEMLAGYELLEGQRLLAEESWRHIVADPGADVMASHAEQAQKLLPVPMSRIATAATMMPTHAALERVVMNVATQIARVRERAAGYEQVLSTLTSGDARGALLGARLHHPLEPALWSDPYFLPVRVGELSPPRVMDLLGEDRTRIRVDAVLREPL